jgi:hypothetical protein
MAGRLREVCRRSKTILSVGDKSGWRNIAITLIDPVPSAKRISPDQFRLLQSSSMDISGNRGHDFGIKSLQAVMG